MGSLAGLVLTGALLAEGASGVTMLWSWAPELFIELSWRLNPATLWLAVLVTGVGTLIVQYAGAYFGPTEKGKRAIGILTLFEAAMLGVVLSDNLFGLYVFWELTGLASFFLIAIDADKRDDAYPAARAALLVTAGGALPMLVGFIVLAVNTGTASLDALVTGAALPLGLQLTAFALIVPGIVTKSAQAPLHFWLPGAMAAPTPVSAYLHSATMVKAGIILLLFLQPVLGETRLWSAVLLPAGAVTCAWGSWRALAEDDIKLLMAWSTVSQLGLMTLTLGLGTDFALRAALLHLYAHAIFKAGLFLCVGGVDHAAHTRSLDALGGMRSRAPAVFAASVILGVSMMGIPPVAGFLSKELILESALNAESWIRTVALLGAVLGSIGTVAYTLRYLVGVFGGEPRSKGAREAQGPGAGFSFGPLVLAALTLAIGVLPGVVDRGFLQPVASALIGAKVEAEYLALWHGVTPALLTSIGIVAGGALAWWLLGARKVRGELLVPTGEKLFESFLEGLRRLGRPLVVALDRTNPALYFGIALFLGFTGAIGLLFEGPVPLPVEWHLPALTVVAVQAAAIVAMMRLPGRLARILMLTAVGFTVAILFRLMEAPDLLMTQLMVEVLTTVFLALAIRLLPIDGQQVGMRRRWKALRAALAGAAGVAGAAIVLSLFAQPEQMRLKEYFAHAGPEVSKGYNLVNVILVDFRGLDTFIETTVVIVAAIGVAGLLRRREVPLPKRAVGTEEEAA